MLASPFSPRPARPGTSGAPPPDPDLLAIGLRLLVALSVVLAWLLPHLGPWSQTLRASARASLPPADPSEALLAGAARLAHLVAADLLAALSHPPASLAILAVALIGGAVLVLELIGAALTLTAGHDVSKERGVYLRVRPLQAQSRGKAAAADPLALWSALLPVVAAACRRGSAVALTLHARPDLPPQLGVAIAGSEPSALSERPLIVQRRAAPPGLATGRWIRPAPLPDVAAAPTSELGQAVAAAIQGQEPDCVVRLEADPLRTALLPGRALVWQELRLARPAHLPLQAAERAGATAASVAAAMRLPLGVVAAELQLVAVHRAEAQDVPWRQRGRRRAHRLRRRSDLAVGDELRAIEEKVGGERLDMSIRLVAVARGTDDVPAATAAIAAMRRALEQTQSRSGRGVQRLIPAGLRPTRLMVIAGPSTTSHWRSGLPWLGLAGLAGLVVAAIGAPSLAALGLTALTLALRLGWIRAKLREVARVIRRGPRPIREPWLLPAPLWPAPALLALREAAALWALPDAGLLGLFDTQPNRLLPVPADMFVPEGATDWITLGHAQRGDGVLAPVGIPLRSLRQMLHVTSAMGGGKSQFDAALIWQLIPWGCLVLDGKGDDRASSLVAVVRQFIPLESEPRLAIVDALDADWPIGLNPLAGIDMRDPAAATQALGTVLSILARLDPGWSESVGMQQYAQMATMLILEGERAPTLANLKQALQDEAYRQRLLARCTNIEVVNFWTVTFPKTSSQQKNSLDALLRRLDNAFVSELTRYMLAIPEPSIDLDLILEEGYILLFPLAHNALGELAEFVAMLMFWSIVRAAYRRPGSDRSRSTVAMFMDEFQVFVGRGNPADLKAATSQLRSLGVGIIPSHQSLKQLLELLEELLQNASNRIILRTGEPDSATYARMYAAFGITSVDIAAQPPAEHQYLV
ncbi:MAG: hypothetical protein HGA45_03700, partial [Chloroflexales bacterium]|nr:hypothetical protein [Chloroflexales bacterium]